MLYEYLRCTVCAYTDISTNVWSYIRRVCVEIVFHNAERKIFHYYRWESAQAVLRGFGILPIDLHLILTRLLSFFNCMLSELRIVRVCSEII